MSLAPGKYSPNPSDPCRYSPLISPGVRLPADVRKAAVTDETSAGMCTRTLYAGLVAVEHVTVWVRLDDRERQDGGVGAADVGPRG